MISANIYKIAIFNIFLNNGNGYSQNSNFLIYSLTIYNIKYKYYNLIINIFEVNVIFSYLLDLLNKLNFVNH